MLTPGRAEIFAFLLPVLAGCYSVLNYLETNINEVRATEALPLLGGVTLFSIILYLFVRVLCSGPGRSSMIATLILILILYLHPIVAGVESLRHLEIKSWIFGGTVVFLVTLYGFRTRKSTATFESTVKVLMVFFGIAILMPAYNIAAYELGRFKAENTESGSSEIEDIVLDGSIQKRSVFYIILDRYGDKRTLESEFNYDNSAFLSFLRSKGFYVADNSTSNYLKTAQSLSSSLSMEYHQFALSQLPRNKSDRTPFFEQIKYNRVARLFKQQGYKYIHLGSWWHGNRTNPIADENFEITYFTPFVKVYLQRGLGSYIMYMLSDSFPRSTAEYQCSTVPGKLIKLNEALHESPPVFVFAHFLLPHDPYVFNEEGRCMDFSERKSLTNVEGYLGQLKFANREIIKFVNNLDSLPGPKPIVIIQADEGPFPDRYRADEASYNWKHASEQELRQKMRILNAYYFPDGGTETLYPHVTPVNSFRILFNAYFDANLSLLPDRNYAFPDYSNIYDFFEVTDVVR